MGEGGLAASLAAPTMTYGNGENQNTKHYYDRGSKATSKKKSSKITKIKGKGTSMACKKKPGKK